MSVIVLGSLNMDLVVRTPVFPLPGQTLTGHRFYLNPGGKGANQAVASARLGSLTRLFGCVGDDDFGTALLNNLLRDNVDVMGVQKIAGISTGIASIVVNDAAENTIVIISGANSLVDVSDPLLTAMTNETSTLLLQLEIPLESVVKAAIAARERGVRVILDPAPAPLKGLPDNLLQNVDFLTPNETEVAALVGFAVNDEGSAQQGAQKLLDRGVANVLIKMGSKGAFWANADGTRMVPALEVHAIDTVAAGDAFNGAFAAMLDHAYSIDEAIRWAMATAAISVTRAGAQTSMPRREEVERFLKNNGVV